MSTLGFVGLGAMGSAVAGRFVSAGHDVVVWNRSSGPVVELERVGARPASSPRQALEAPVSFSMLANDEAVAAVLTDDHLAGGPGRVHVCLSSISPGAAERAEEVCRRNGVGYVAAPVLGRPAVAAAGQLGVLVGGSDEDAGRVAELLQVFASRVWRVSASPRAANIVKIAVNYNIIHALQALGESIAMVEEHGVDANEFVEVLHATLFGGVVHGGYGPMIADRAYRPAGFTLGLGQKDLLLADGIAREAGLELATMPALIRVFQQALADPALAECDWSAIAEVSRRSPRP